MTTKKNNKPDKIFEQLIPIQSKSAVLAVNEKLFGGDLEFGVVHTILCLQLCRILICNN